MRRGIIYHDFSNGRRDIKKKVSGHFTVRCCSLFYTFHALTGRTEGNENREANASLFKIIGLLQESDQVERNNQS